MEKKKKKIWLIGGLVLCLVAVIGITFAFFSTGGTQDTANTFTSGCLNIELTDASSSINLTNTYPISDVEGVDSTSYDFTIRNTCDTPTNYSINLESLNQVANTLNADYIKVSLSSNTIDNVISKLSDNIVATPEIDGAYEAYTLYTGSINAHEEKTYHLKLWIDYDATVEQAANKTYSSKINVTANPETSVVDTLEATFTLDDKTLTSSLSNNVTSATYCTTTTNICEPTTPATITNNSYTVELEGNGNTQMVCTKLNGTSKVICSNGLEVKPIPANEYILASKNAPTNSTTDWTNNGTGITYYYTGDTNEVNNWVSFAGFYWRIIRINGDGTIRMIYQGVADSPTPDDGNIRGEETQIGTKAFNVEYDNNMYVGFKYGSDSSDYATTHANINNSTILGADDSDDTTTLNGWYRANLLEYTSYIDGNAGFCGDRTQSTSDSSTNGLGGTGTTITYYGAYIRLYNKGTSNSNPSLQCNSQDIYTTTYSSSGNKSLQYPIGLVTADEVALTGIAWNNIQSSYLNTGEYYWTMSPYYFNGGYALMFIVSSISSLGIEAVYSILPSVRPVINICSDIQLTGTGSQNDPFVVVGAN